MNRPAVLLTGASRGIGSATAMALAARGARLGLLGRPSSEFESVVLALRSRSAEVEAIDCDLVKPEELDRAARQFLDQFGAPDAVIHNAGVVRRAPVEAHGLARWEEQMAVNARAPFLLTAALLPSMRQRGCGRIVHVASISSTLGTASASGYCASKWAVVGFMKSLAEELRDSGLMTLAVLPGSVDTRMLDGSGFTPRIAPEEVAKTLSYFALDAPTAHNGAVVEMFGV